MSHAYTTGNGKHAGHSAAAERHEEHFEITFDGAPLTADAGQTVGGALHRAGQHVLSRSFKYHRPRGLFCASGRCPNCMCTVDGEPNVRICTLAARPGMRVTSQNRWPALWFDAMAIFDRFHRLMPVGFYYQRMYKPRWMWPLWEKIIRRIAGLGCVDRHGGDKGHYDKLNLFTDVAVVGGGWAGLHAALEAAGAGADVTLIDEQPALGGHLRCDPHLAPGMPGALASTIAKVAAHAKIRVIDSAVAFGCYEGNYLGIQRGNRMIRLRAEQIIIATSGWERPLVFANNDLPGNLLASGAQRLIHLDGCRFDGPIVVVTDNAQGYRVARQLVAGGMGVVRIVDLRREAGDDAAGIQLDRGRTVLAARGKRHIKAAVIGSLVGEPQEVIRCRWIVQAVGFTPANALLYQNGCKLGYDAGLDHPVVRSYAVGMHSAGAVNGVHYFRAVELEGRIAGLTAVVELSAGGATPQAGLSQRLSQLRHELDALPPKTTPAMPYYVSPSSAKKKFVCICEDVTEKDICDAIDEGYSNIETLKRYSTVSMGPCQGKMCQAVSIALCARQNGKSIEATGTTTARPPEQPVPFGVLAGRAVHLSLVRRTCLHDWHVAASARFMDAGNWKRPERYGRPEDEYEAVRHRAGLIDVSTLGKIELRGRDVVAFLEFIYPNRFANLKIGSVRYGLICDDAGIILDDGTISRLGDDRFFLTTTTGNADAIDSWFRWWLACKPSLDVRLTNVSGSYAAMNLAGPRSREILAGLTDADLSTRSMPYLAVGQFAVAGVPANVLRIGFVGELGYEIHVPTQYGLHVWEAIMNAGRPFDILPFGVEAQRRLRLDKKHILPGTDTDALSNPLEADLPWIVKLEKADFIGRSSLGRMKQRGPRNRLVGFRMKDGVVPEDASLVLCDGKLGGRVTSCRYSPVNGAAVGLAWVPDALARDGQTFQIQVNGKLATAIVQDEPFYDAAGEKLKS